MDTAQSINAITDDFVEAVGAQSMADVFMMVPGLNMTGSRDGDHRYSVRGLTSQTGQTGYYIGLVGFIDSYSERWVQEFRLVSPGDHRLRWTVGAFWKDSEDTASPNRKACTSRAATRPSAACWTRC